MATLRLFASAREAAGVARVEIEAGTVEELLGEAQHRFGDRFVEVVAVSRIWVNGGPAGPATEIAAHDVVAVLPPVSGGAPAAPASGAKETPLPAAHAHADSSARPAPAAPHPARPRHLHLVQSGPVVDEEGPGDEEVAGGVAGPSAPPYRPPVSFDALARTLAPAPLPAPDVDAPAEPERTEPVDSSPTPGLRSRQPLAVIPTFDRPHGRLGLAWAAVTAVALAPGPVVLAAWLALCSGVAAAQVVRAWVSRGQKLLSFSVVATAVALPLAAASGVTAMNATIVVSLVGMLATRALFPGKAPLREVGLSFLIAVAVGWAAAAPVLLRDINLAAPMFLLACAAAYDAGAYLVGTGARSVWEGPVGGVAALLPLTLMAAVALEPPFQGAAPMVLGALAAVLAPLGPLAASLLLGDRDASAPALRRLDSLLVLGPVWCFAAASFFL